MGIRSRAHYAAYWDFRAPRTGAPVPFLESEAMYEGIICGPRFAGANDTRVAAWKAVLSGSLGVTYGAAALWLFKHDVNDTTGQAYNPGTWWWPNLALPGSLQVAALSRALGPPAGGGLIGAAWDSLAPRYGDAAFSAFADDEATVLATTAEGAYAVYAYGAGAALGSLRGLDPAAAWRATWFDPRAGAAAGAVGVEPSAAGEWMLPERPGEGDWALFVTRA